MGFITDFNDFRQKLRDWSEKGTSLDAFLADFISMATDSLNLGDAAVQDPLRVREMLAVTSLSPTSGACTLPADYLQYRRVVELASIRRELEFIVPSVADQTYPTRPAGLACDFTIVGPSLMMFPASANNIELTYYQAVPALSDSATTNWLLLKHPSLYLNAALMHLFAFVNDQAKMTEKASLVNAGIAALNSASQVSEFARAAFRPKGFHP
jgi:hypothetical protein